MVAEDELLLATLADAGHVALTNPELAGLTNLPERKVAERMNWLASKHLVRRPKGTQRKGRGITAAGLSAIGRSAEGALVAP